MARAFLKRQFEEDLFSRKYAKVLDLGGKMQDINAKATLKTLVKFQALSSVSLSLSADGRWLAYGDGDSLFIGRWKNRAPHLSNVQEGPEVADLVMLEWSPDSKYLLATSDRIIYLVKRDNPVSAISFAELEELGIRTALWSYDSTFVIVVDECRAATVVLRIGGAVHWLPGVRMVNKQPLLALRPDCQTLAMCAYQSQVGECLMVFRCEDWSLMWKVQSNCTFISGISWFPNSKAVFVWDSIARFCVDFIHPDGSFKHTMTPAKVTDAGIRVASMSPCSSLFVTFDDNSKIHLYNTLIWRLVSVFDLCTFSNRADTDLTSTKFLCWSACSQYCAFASSTSAHVKIWSKIHTDHFDFRIDDSSITDMAWHRKKPILAMATGSRQICLLKCPGNKNESTPGIELCKFRSTISVKELRWEGANPSCLVVRKSKGLVAVTCIQ